MGCRRHFLVFRGLEGCCACDRRCRALCRSTRRSCWPHRPKQRPPPRSSLNHRRSRARAAPAPRAMKGSRRIWTARAAPLRIRYSFLVGGQEVRNQRRVFAAAGYRLLARNDDNIRPTGWQVLGSSCGVNFTLSHGVLLPSGIQFLRPPRMGLVMLPESQMPQGFGHPALSLHAGHDSACCLWGTGGDD